MRGQMLWHGPATTWLLAILVALAASSACQRGSPILDPTPRNPSADATISGSVRGPAGTAPIAGRIVHAVNVDTGALMRGATNEAGGFTFKVAPGRYRVEVTLLPGETIAEQPDVLDVEPGDLEVSADFVLNSSGRSTARPRIRLRMDDGLGAPSA
jgi:hypothetical protein